MASPQRSGILSVLGRIKGQDRVSSQDLSERSSSRISSFYHDGPSPKSGIFSVLREICGQARVSSQDLSERLSSRILILPQRGVGDWKSGIKVNKFRAQCPFCFGVFRNNAFSRLITHFRQSSISRISGISGIFRPKTLHFWNTGPGAIRVLKNHKNVVLEISNLQSSFWQRWPPPQKSGICSVLREI